MKSYRRTFVFLAFAMALPAQQVVAPTPEQVGSVGGSAVGGYTVNQSFEAGVRQHGVGGDEGMYRTVANFGNGVRLLGSSLSVYSKDGHGQWFDELTLNTLGLGNDPYQSVILRIQKNHLYRYDMNWRLDAYFNPGLDASDGLHAQDTTRHLQDHDFTLFPQSFARLRLGYSRNTDDGPAYSTSQEFDANGYGLLVLSNVRQTWNEYRLGGDLDLYGFRLTVTHRWNYFKDDTPYFSAGPQSAPPPDQTVLQNFVRAAPAHGSNPAWLVNLFTQRKYWGLNARYTHVDGERRFSMNELASGIGTIGNAASRQIITSGDAHRPVIAGDLSISVTPTEKLTLVNNTSVLSNRIDGNSTYSEFNSGFDLGTTLYFRYLGDRLVTNSTNVNYRVRNWIGFYGGYAYSDREVHTIYSPDPFNGASIQSYRVSTTLNTGTAGVRIRPWKPFSINLEGEIGRAGPPFTNISQRNYTSLNGRVEYRTKTVQLSAAYKQAYNINPPFNSGYFYSHSRSYSLNGSWAPKDWLGFDASYNKLHLDTYSALAFFASPGNRPQLQTAFPSIYLSNVHNGYLGVRVSVLKRADVYLGYSIVRDTGDGRPAAVPVGVTNPVEALLDSVQTFPLSYQSPLARVSFRITPKVRWNVGWQYYGYHEEFHILGNNQNFRAQTGYTSILWSF